jgi:hypothetical protein
LPAIYAVLTGDLVGSRQAGSAATSRTIALLDQAARSAPWAGASPLSRFRGDGWQLLLSDTSMSLRTALFLNAFLKSQGAEQVTRIGLGVGPLTALGNGDLSAADGPAFHRAGAALDTMSRNERLTLAADGLPSPALPALVALADTLARRWTEPQATALVHLLPPDAPTQVAVAAQLSIRPQSLSDRLGAAGYDGIMAGLVGYEAALKDQVKRPYILKYGSQA